jgi:hypothetical protein
LKGTLAITSARAWFVLLRVNCIATTGGAEGLLLVQVKLQLPAVVSSTISLVLISGEAAPPLILCVRELEQAYTYVVTLSDAFIDMLDFAEPSHEAGVVRVPYLIVRDIWEIAALPFCRAVVIIAAFLLVRIVLSNIAKVIDPTMPITAITTSSSMIVKPR